MRFTVTIFCLVFIMAQGCYSQAGTSKQKNMNMPEKKNNAFYSHTDTGKLNVGNEEWKQLLSPQVFEVARNKATERPFTSAYERSKEIGTFYCAVCGNPLFKSDTKFESGCGWPSFFEPISKTALVEEKDTSLGMIRTEVVCGRCGSHLGHVFDDGPPPTGLRYCINGVVLDFEKAQQAEKNFLEKGK